MKSKLNENIKQKFLKEFGENFKTIRKEKKLSQIDLAVKIDGDAKKVRRVEQGLYDFKISSLLILANALETNVEKLICIKNLNNFKKTIWDNSVN